MIRWIEVAVVEANDYVGVFLSSENSTGKANMINGEIVLLNGFNRWSAKKCFIKGKHTEGNTIASSGASENCLVLFFVTLRLLVNYTFLVCMYVYYTVRYKCRRCYKIKEVSIRR